MNQNKIKLIFLCLALSQMFVANLAVVQTASDAAYAGPENSIKQFLCAPTASNTTGTNNAAGDLYVCINRIYRFAIILVSSGAVLYIVIAGYMYMSSEGNGEMVE